MATTTQYISTQSQNIVHPTSIDQNPEIIAAEPVDENYQRISTFKDPIKSEFGKIKGIEIIAFKHAELEKTINGLTTFGTIGILQVLYFATYDRFVLALGDWKYALLKRIPIVASQNNMNSAVGPITYNLPTYNGFFTLTIPKIDHIETLKNFETILINNSKFSYRGTENILSRNMERSPDTSYRNRYSADTNVYPTTNLGEVNTHPPTNYGQTSTYPTNLAQTTNYPTNLAQTTNYPTNLAETMNYPTNTYQSGMYPSSNTLNQSPSTQSVAPMEEGGPIALKAGQKWKRGFKRFGFMFSRMSGKEKRNLNNYQSRDIESLKRTNEVMAPLHLYPRREVERWISYNKEIANALGFNAESYQEGSPMGDSRLRGYGSMDLGQGSLSNPSHFREGGISSVRPSLDNLRYSTGQLHTVPVGSTSMGYAKPRWTDKMKSKMSGEHHYYGEKTAGEKAMYETHSIHPGLSQSYGQNFQPGRYESRGGEQLGQSSYQTQTYNRTESPMSRGRTVQFAEPERASYDSTNLQRYSGEYATDSFRPPMTTTSYQGQTVGGLQETSSPMIGTTTTMNQREPYVETIREPSQEMIREPYVETRREPIQETIREPIREIETTPYNPVYTTSTERAQILEPSKMSMTSQETGHFAVDNSNRIEEQLVQSTQSFATPAYIEESTSLGRIGPETVEITHELPNLTQRIRETPLTTAGRQEFGEPGRKEGMTFLQRVKQAWHGPRETNETTERQIPLPDLDVIRGDTAHYQG